MQFFIISIIFAGSHKAGEEINFIKCFFSFREEGKQQRLLAKDKFIDNIDEIYREEAD